MAIEGQRIKSMSVGALHHITHFIFTHLSEYLLQHNFRVAALANTTCNCYLVVVPGFHFVTAFPCCVEVHERVWAECKNLHISWLISHGLHMDSLFLSTFTTISKQPTGATRATGVLAVNELAGKVRPGQISPPTVVICSAQVVPGKTVISWVSHSPHRQAAAVFEVAWGSTPDACLLKLRPFKK